MIFDQGREIPDDFRQKISWTLEAAETVFVNDAATGTNILDQISITESTTTDGFWNLFKRSYKELPLQ